MKRVDLIRELERGGCVLIRNGGRHDWYQNPRTRVCQPVPRHREIKEGTVRAVCRQLDIPKV